MKKSSLIIMVSIMLLVGCSNEPISNIDTATNTGGNNTEAKIDVPTEPVKISEAIKSSLTKVEGDGYSFKYIIKNKSLKEVTLTFNTSQEFNYILWRKDAKGTMAYDYSKDKSFNKEFHKKTLQPDEELAYDIVLNHDHEPRTTYVLEVYMTSNEPELGSPSKFHQNLEFTFEHNNEQTNYIDFSIEMKEVHDFTDEIIDKVQNELKENEWVTSNFYLNGKTYVLLGAPKQVKEMRIDIDGFKINEDKIIIYYQTFDFHGEPIGLKTHLLYEFEGEYKIEFLKTYSTEQ